MISDVPWHDVEIWSTNIPHHPNLIDSWVEVVKIKAETSDSEGYHVTQIICLCITIANGRAHLARDKLYLYVILRILLETLHTIDR